MSYAVMVPIILRLIGLARYTTLALKIIPWVTTYGPILERYINAGIAGWDAFKKSHPDFAAKIEGIAKKILPNLPLDEASALTLKATFMPHKMTPSEESKWMDRASDAGAGG